MKRNNAYSSRELGGNLYLFPDDGNMAEQTGLPVLNESAGWLWNALSEEVELPTLVSGFAERYGLDTAVAEEDVLDCLRAMSAAGLILGFH